MANPHIPVELLKIGHHICLPMGWTNHPFMLSSFKIKTAEQVAVLRSLGLGTVEVDAKKSDIPLPIIEQAAEQESASTAEEISVEKQREDELRQGQKRAAKAYEQSADKFREALTKFTSKPDEAYYSLFEQTNETLKQLYLHEGAISVFISLEPSSDEDVFFHSVNVAILSALMAKNMGMEQKQNQILSLAALCHDVGELKVPSQIRRKPGDWTKAEQNFYQTHPKFSYELIKKAESFPEAILPIVLNHHERLDGSGYPKGKSGKQIDPMSQLLAVVDAFEHLCAPLPSAKKYMPQEAFATLYKQAGTKFNKTYVEALMTVLGIYPPGAYVSLDDGSYGLVIASNPNDKLSPNILLLAKGKNFDNASIIDLSAVDLKIKKTVNPEDIPASLTKHFDMRSRHCYFFDPV